jgi:hypothetical protein
MGDNVTVVDGTMKHTKEEHDKNKNHCSIIWSLRFHYQ